MPQEQSKKLKISTGTFYIPKAKRHRPCGEDAHFVDNKAQVIGVADGVGSWSKKGIDAGRYARQLMGHAAAAVKGCHPADVYPKGVLVKAFLNSEAKGTSTACIISVSGHRFWSANLGDSSVMVIRNGKVKFKSKTQQHKFNNPYQVGNAPKFDSPFRAKEKMLKLKEEDVILAGTDGLWDNLFTEEILNVVKMCSGMKDPAVTAWTLAHSALLKSLQRQTVSPFEIAAHKANKPHHFGGKYDDITVVVAYCGYADSVGN